MSSVSAPFGLRPSYHPSGTIRTAVGTITSASANNVFHNAPVRIDSAATRDILPAATGNASTLIGSMQGVEYTMANQRRTVSNWWPTGTVALTSQGPGTVLYYTQDPWITYAIQANGTVARTHLGSLGGITAQSGDTGTGLSSVMLDIATLGTAVDQLQIVGLQKGPDNDWGDTYTVVDVQIACHQLAGPRPALA